MTRNQSRAVTLAGQIIMGQLKANQLPDDDWCLLLLASGVNNPRSMPLLASHRVLEQQRDGRGYFASHALAGGRLA